MRSSLAFRTRSSTNCHVTHLRSSTSSSSFRGGSRGEPVDILSSTRGRQSRSTPSRIECPCQLTLSTRSPGMNDPAEAERRTNRIESFQGKLIAKTKSSTEAHTTQTRECSFVPEPVPPIVLKENPCRVFDPFVLDNRPTRDDPDCWASSQGEVCRSGSIGRVGRGGCFRATRRQCAGSSR